MPPPCHAKRVGEPGSGGIRGRLGAALADAMTTSEVTLQPPSTEPARSGCASRRKRWPYVTGGILVLVLVIVIVCVPDKPALFRVIPGQAQAVGPLLSVPAGRGHPMNGQLLLTDVGEGDVTVGNWLYYKLDSNAQLYPKSDFIATGHPSSSTTSKAWSRWTSRS